MDEYLEDLGLSKHEISLYKVLLKLGPSQAGVLSTKTGIHRRNVYDALERLVNKGFVGYMKENNVKIYSLSNPELILEKLELKRKNFEEILPTIMESFNLKNEKSETLFFRGKEGLKLVFEDQIRVGEEILVNATSVNVSDFLKYYFPKFERERREKGIHMRMIFDKKFENESNDLNKVPLCSYKFIKDFNTSPMSSYVYGDNVAIVVWGEKPLAILIRQKEVAQGFRESFEILWKL